MEMHQIRYFLAVCDTLNFTRAAEQCNVTQPALTRAIQKLEEELGGQLLRRERGLTHLTELGRLMQAHLAQILEQSDAAKTTARGFLKLEKAPLHLGLMCTIGPRRLIDFLSYLQRKNPGIELLMHEGTPGQLGQRLMAGELEVALFAQPTPLDERFDAHPLYRERFTVAFPPGHRFERSREVAVADLDGESYLGRLNCEYWDQLAALLRAKEAHLTTPFRSEREDWIQTMILAGFGVSFLPEYSIIVDGVQTRPVCEPPVEREINVVTVAGRQFSPPVAALIRDIKTYNWPD
jgi:DNA-binding transcriptional LysR family regulator